MLTYAKEFMFSPVSLCLSVNRITIKLLINFFNEILLYGWTIQGPIDYILTARGQKVKIFFANNTFKIVVKSHHKKKSKSSLIDSIIILNMIMAVGLTVSGIGRAQLKGQRGQVTVK